MSTVRPTFPRCTVRLPVVQGRMWGGVWRPVWRWWWRRRPPDLHEVSAAWCRLRPSLQRGVVVAVARFVVSVTPTSDGIDRTLDSLLVADDLTWRTTDTNNHCTPASDPWRSRRCTHMETWRWTLSCRRPVLSRQQLSCTVTTTTTTITEKN